MGSERRTQLGLPSWVKGLGVLHWDRQSSVGPSMVWMGIVHCPYMEFFTDGIEASRLDGPTVIDGTRYTCRWNIQGRVYTEALHRWARTLPFLQTAAFPASVLVFL